MEVFVEEPSFGRVLHHVMHPLGKVPDHFGGDSVSVDREVDVVQSILGLTLILDGALHQVCVGHLQGFLPSIDRYPL
jgi:hypothetical protein